MSVVSGVVGAATQKSSADKAASATKKAAQMSTDTQRYMFDEMMKLQDPYNQAGLKALGQLPSVDPSAEARKYQSQVENMPALALPSLNLDSFNFAFNPNDPTYQYRQKEMEETINQAAAARGNYNSRPVINALSEGNMALTADESEKQFGRALDTYNANVSTALSQYGADYGKTTDTYNAGYGKLTDLFNMSSNLGASDYNRLVDLVKIGQGSAGSAGQGAIATGQGLANTYGQLGNSLASTQIAKGQATSDLMSNIGKTNTQAGTLALLKYLEYI
jgi:hypothetical protein